MSELKPCPFCGGAPDLIHLNAVWIVCSNPTCFVKPDTRAFDEDEISEAFSAWNTRRGEPQ